MATVVVVDLGFFFSLAARRFEKKSWYQSERDSVVVVSVVVSSLTVIRLLRSTACGSPAAAADVGDLSKLSSFTAGDC